MTNYEHIIEFNEEQMIEFLYAFAKDTINMFGQFIMPSKERIRDFLEIDIDKSED